MAVYCRANAREYCGRQDWQGLLEFAKAWQLAEPEQYYGPYYLGVALGALGLPAAAIAAYDKAIGINSNDANVWDNLALETGKAKGFQEAEKFHRVAVRIEPPHARANYNYGTLLARAGRLSEAIKFLTRAHELDPTDVDTAKCLMYALYENKAYPSMRAFLPTFQMLVPERTAAYRSELLAAERRFGIKLPPPLPRPPVGH